MIKKLADEAHHAIALACLLEHAFIFGGHDPHVCSARRSALCRKAYSCLVPAYLTKYINMTNELSVFN